MIARIWRGVTLISNADGYLEYLKRKVIPRYQGVEGNQGIFILREKQGELVFFLLLSFWSSYEAMIKVTSPDTRYLHKDPEEKELLIAFESIVKHYEVVDKHINLH